MFFSAAAGFAQIVVPPPPIRVQYQLLRKVLSFDRSLRFRSPEGIVLGVAYVGDIAGSVIAKDEFLKIVLDSRPSDIEGLAVRAVPIAFTSAASFSAALRAARVNLLYIAPVADADLRGIIPVCASMKIPTVSGIGPYVTAGVAVILRHENGRPAIFVNLNASRKQGFDFSARLLRLARIFGSIDERSRIRR